MGIALKIKSVLYKHFIPSLLEKACPDRIPRTGENAKKVDCFTIAIDKMDGEPYMLVEGFCDTKFKGLIWSGSKYEKEGTIPLNELDGKYKLQITHFKGPSTVFYYSIWDLAYNYTTKLPYIVLFFENHIFNFFYKKRPLFSYKKMELLRYLIDDDLDSNKELKYSIEYEPRIITVLNLMGKLYSRRWSTHPQSQRSYRTIQLHLDALKAEGALKENQNGYYLTGVALSIMEKYEEEERTHKGSVRLNWFILGLTLVIAFSATIQAEIIKIPTIINFID